MSNRQQTCSEPLETEAFFLTVQDHRLAAQRLLPAGASADGPWLVFLHEALGSIAQWREVPALLAERLSLPALLYERRGFGGSDPMPLPQPDDYLEHESEVVLPQVLDLCGIDRPLLIGHSDGATIALLFAAAYPERPLAVVSEAGHVFMDERIRSGVAETSATWPDGRLRRALERYHGDKAETLFRAWSDTWQSEAFADWTVVERLREIRCPLLAIQGAHDQYGTLGQLDTIAALSGGPSERLLLDCAHVPHLEAQAETLAAIETFVRRVVQPR